MIKNIIFDFGDIFINLDKQGFIDTTLKTLKIDAFSESIINSNNEYEKGNMSTDAFLSLYENTFPHLSRPELIDLWNCILKDFPKHRLEFLLDLAETKKYKLFLLSNTNELHIDSVKETVPFYETFKSCFDVFYLSHEIHFRKPDAAIYEFVLKQNNLVASETLFIDDVTENTESAKQLGIHTWNLNPETEEVTELFTKNKNLF